MDDLAPRTDAPGHPGSDGWIAPPDLASSEELPIDLRGEPAAAAESSPLLTALERLEISLAEGLAVLLEEFRGRLALDRFKEDQIARLHGELQTYKSDLVNKTARQLLQGLIRLHDDLGKMASALRQKPPEELTPERFFQQFAGFQDDIELLLGQHGVESFTSPGEAFDPRRQTAARTVPTDDPGRVGQVAERLRPGFEQGEALLQKERVAVYVASNGSNEKAQGGHS
jgi:molecular chaperone GrpE